MKRNEFQLDWLSLVLFGVFLLFGWFNIYAASTNDASLDLFNIHHNYGKQFLYILAAGGVGTVILLFINRRDIELSAYLVYLATILALAFVILFGREVHGATSWFEIASFRFQPSEFAKIGTLLALAKFMSAPNFTWKNLRHRLTVFGMIALPAGLVVLQGDTGTAIIYAGFLFVFYREGLSPVYLILLALLGGVGILALLLNRFVVLNVILLLGVAVYLLHAKPPRWLTHLMLTGGSGVVVLMLLLYNNFRVVLLGVPVTHTTLIIALDGLLLIALLAYMIGFRNRYWPVYLLGTGSLTALTFGIDYVFKHILQPHQRDRIVALFNPRFDPMGVNWNTTQSKIAIGSGGLAGKGYLEGTQTKFDFVPQQHTDFIFCTIGEEWGWLGTTTLLILFGLFLWQLTMMAEECKSDFGRIFSYGVVSIFFTHIAINIAMTIGLAPVIGIPLPFFSYGGSSLMAFTVMVFIVLKYYANRGNVLR